MRALYDSKSKLDDRGIKALLSETEKYRTWLKVEAALALAQAEEGFIPREAAQDIASVRFEDLDLAEMELHKARVGHGFVPFVKVLVKACRGRAQNTSTMGSPPRISSRPPSSTLQKKSTGCSRALSRTFWTIWEPWPGTTRTR